jgi:hypothetical protein
MEMCYLRGDCRPGDFGESAVDKDGPGAKHEKQEKVRGLIWARLLIPKNTIWSAGNGKGKLPMNPDEFDVCRRWGGFGLIKKESEIFGEVEDREQIAKVSQTDWRRTN